MPSCNCGGKKVTIKKASIPKGHIKKHQPAKVAVPKKAASKGHVSAASKKATAVARKAALAKPNPYAKGCKC